MDVALTVAGYVTMMHDGQKVVEGTPAEIRAQPDGARHLPRQPLPRGGRDVSDVCSRSRGSTPSTARAQALEGVSFSMGQEAVSVIGRNGMGKTTLCNSIMGIEPPNARGSVRFRGIELLGQPVVQDRRHGHRLRAAGAPALRVADDRRAPEDDPDARARASGLQLPSTSSSRVSPSARRSARPSSPAASSRCSRSAARC